MFKSTRIAGAVTASAVAASLAIVAGQQPPASSPIFTAEQVTAGRVAYLRNCASCHMPDLSGDGHVPQLSGELFVKTWGPRSTKELFDYMSTAMPPAGPSQTTETYLAIGAYILQYNGAVTGTQAMSSSTVVPIESVLPARSTQ